MGVWDMSVTEWEWEYEGIVYCSLQLAKQGLNVVIMSRSQVKLQKVADEISERQDIARCTHSHKPPQSHTHRGPVRCGSDGNCCGLLIWPGDVSSTGTAA